MVKKSDSINRRYMEDSTITYGEKAVKVMNSVVFTDKEKREIEARIVDELYNIFTGNDKVKGEV